MIPACENWTEDNAAAPNLFKGIAVVGHALALDADPLIGFDNLAGRVMHHKLPIIQMRYEDFATAKGLGKRNLQKEERAS
jgi:hypothetical protein